MSKILEVNDLCKSFVVKKRLLGENDVVSAVNHVSLGLEEGEVLGIVGESGCGKSTVARLLLHSIRPDSGTMKLCGKEYDMAHATGQDVQTFRKNMQMVFQNPYSSLNPKMNVLQNITFGLTANQVPRDEACRRAYRYLDAVGMQKSFLNKYPNSLSGGQRQRVAVARALAMEPCRKGPKNLPARRAGVRTGQVGAGAGAQPVPRPAEGVRYFDYFYLP